MMKLRQLHKSALLEFFIPSTNTGINIPLFEGGVSAGFPSPAQDFSEHSIDLNLELIKNPASTFFTRVSGDSMKDLGISDGDLLVIDKSLTPKDGKIAVCFIDGEFTLKKIKLEKQTCWLVAANKNYEPIEVTEDNDFIVWGIVTFSIKNF